MTPSTRLHQVQQLSAKLLGNGGGQYALANLLRSGVTFAALPLLFLLMDKAEVDTVALVTPLFWMSQSILTLGAANSLIRTAADEQRSLGALAWISWAQVAVLGVAIGAALAPFSQTLLHVPSQSVWWWTIAVCIGQAGFANTAALLRGTELVKHAVLQTYIGALMPVGLGLLVSLIVPEANASHYIAGLALGTAVTALYGCIVAARLVPGPWPPAVRHLRLAIAVGLPTIPQFASGFVADFLVRRAVNEVSIEGQTAVFAIAMAAAGLVINTLRAISNGWAPRIYKATPEDLPAALASFLRSSLILAFAGHLSATVAMLILQQLGLEKFDVAGITAATYLATSAAVACVPVMGATFLVYKSYKTGHFWWIGPVAALASATVAITALTVTGNWVYAGCTLLVTQLVQGLALLTTHPSVRTNRQLHRYSAVTTTYIVIVVVVLALSA